MERSNQRTFTVYADSRQPATCRSVQCGQPIDFYMTFPRRRRMPVNRGAVPVRSEQFHDGAVLLIFAADASHFATCVARLDFKS